VSLRGWRDEESSSYPSGVWRYVYRAVDQDGQVIDVYVSARRNLVAAQGFFNNALAAHSEPVEVITDLAPALETAIADAVPDTFHNIHQYANNRVECDHGRLKSRLRPLRGLKTDRTAQVVIAGHAFIQNLRRGRYQLGVEAET
jgi:IS6 family transposase